MARSPTMFRQADLTRALRAAISAGLEVAGCEIDPVTGKIKIIIANGTSMPVVDEFARWKATHAD
jgi:hypothetical protein